MKHVLLLMLFSAFLLVQCGLINKNKQKENIVSETPPVKTAEQLAAEEKLRQDSVENAAFELMQKTAFGELIFGMDKEQVEKLNEKRQVLGNYSYNPINFMKIQFLQRLLKPTRSGIRRLE